MNVFTKLKTRKSVDETNLKIKGFRIFRSWNPVQSETCVGRASESQNRSHVCHMNAHSLGNKTFRPSLIEGELSPDITVDTKPWPIADVDCSLITDR